MIFEIVKSDFSHSTFYEFKVDIHIHFCSINLDLPSQNKFRCKDLIPKITLKTIEVRENIGSKEEMLSKMAIQIIAKISEEAAFLVFQQQTKIGKKVSKPPPIHK